MAGEREREIYRYITLSKLVSSPQQKSSAVLRRGEVSEQSDTVGASLFPLTASLDTTEQ